MVTKGTLALLARSALDGDLQVRRQRMMRFAPRDVRRPEQRDRGDIERRGEVVSIDQLLHEAWGADVFLTDRVVYTHVNNLRTKIEPDPRQPRHIVSVRGVGYRFEE